MKRSLDAAIAKVLDRDNCSGCGACALISTRVEMVLDNDGFMRPEVRKAGTSVSDRADARTFHQVCPGVRVVAPAVPKGTKFHPVFGTYFSAWEGWATDSETRFRGSSAGVLTALSTWLLETDRVQSVVGSAAGRSNPSRTVPVRILDREEALQAAGSRYGPVSNLVEHRPLDPAEALVGKPCEISAAYQLHDALDGAEDSRPIMLSFFCAGTPSQNATDNLVEKLGVELSDAVSMRYRGNGWPGRFTVVGSDGQSKSLSYDQSWGDHLGRDLQWRCKICADGTGGHADVAVGDYWNADETGFPLFNDADGVSAVIARSLRGAQLLDEARTAGVLLLKPLDLDRVASIQPLQTDRKYTLAGRILARLIAAKPAPRYRGYHLTRIASRAIKRNLRSFAGTLRRSIAWLQ